MLKSYDSNSNFNDKKNCQFTKICQEFATKKGMCIYKQKIERHFAKLASQRDAEKKMQNFNSKVIACS